MSFSNPAPCQAIVIGGSAGGTQVLRQILLPLPADFRIPIIVCSHLHASDEGGYTDSLSDCSMLAVVEAQDKLPISQGVYVAPANYHLLVEQHRAFALSIDERVHDSRPSIDVLFESAARVFGSTLIGILLSGRNEDGADGLRTISQQGGLTLVQDPSTAEQPTMPLAAIARQAASKVLSPEEIEKFVNRQGYWAGCLGGDIDAAENPNRR